MNILPTEAGAFAERLRSGLQAVPGVQKIVCPPYLSLPAVADRLKNSDIHVGAQNMHYEAKGAYTGEVSHSMVREFCEYVILGHSERRRQFGETDEMVAKKVTAAIDVGLKTILCVGEVLAEREAGDATVVVQRQVRAALREVPSLEGVIVAYEPVWAIGSGFQRPVRRTLNTSWSSSAGCYTKTLAAPRSTSLSSTAVAWTLRTWPDLWPSRTSTALSSEVRA